LRLTQLGRDVGLVSDARYDRMMRKREQTRQALAHFTGASLPMSDDLRAVLSAANEPAPDGAVRISEYLKRPRITYALLRTLDKSAPAVEDDALEQAEIAIKYEGYIARAQRDIARAQKLEQLALPDSLDYAAIHGLRNEARQKLSLQRPRSIGQAGRISGVSPADVAVLLVYLEKLRRGASSPS
ncbi:MAG: tRNA uridine-5-carboxymethylaminomethyl(34) synthesis enzyme MnmG, partial [Eubacteriales bacterium]|nr:tRNA uridine-5-carboxymethylaminomethyl(34) synthesis enzyme MnmG [Eubacteriales bacterium]